VKCNEYWNSCSQGVKETKVGRWIVKLHLTLSKNIKLYNSGISFYWQILLQTSVAMRIECILIAKKEIIGF